MVEKKKETFVDLGRLESEKFEPDSEVRAEFEEAARLTGEHQLTERMRAHQSPANDLLENSIDASADDPDMQEGAGAGQPPQSEVDEIGKAVGLTYEDGERMHTTEKVEDRDRHRWELDPASSEGFDERSKHEGEHEEK